MYTFIRDARRPVTRDEAAAAVGISRKLAAFHLDKLVDAGVLRADYQQVSGVRKAGRTPKVYQPVDADIRVSLPPRQHELLADILLDALLPDGHHDHDGKQAALRAARERGHAIGATERRQARPGRLGAERALTVATTMLHRHGFEPDRISPTCLRLRTCPFHPLAAKAPEMVCGVNHAFFAGLLDGLGATSVQAVLDPRAGECCVELRAHP
ncbi:helix-turn-helix transcriptional regulator [Amycolatopsis pithecellobii]|uniref:Transcriptional regulator n=1 Tax=Amycolatopsis pithecellobii TaxID=664692 RepID=A0A6N7YKN1_9PSEU|nr:transcriptional regulator [Amycolatopsis pithecellobii]MTD52572.1 transcriptional regulator [Amycolatopsis pithecellobii]